MVVKSLKKLYNKFFINESNIKFIKIDKHPIYSGECRNSGFPLVEGEIISYLDNDDVLGKETFRNHNE